MSTAEAGRRHGPRVLIVAGEASGDQHGAGLVRASLERSPGMEFIGVTGPEMREAGVETLVDASELAVIGILEVARHLPKIFTAWRCLSRALKTRPDLVVLIDYPDFNLRLARKARRAGIPVLYFVSPQVWAWRPGRIRTIADRVDRMMVLFGFEEELYRRAGVPVTWVGHPLADAAARGPSREEARSALGLEGQDRLVALLPGSREGELRRMLPVMLNAADRLAAEHAGLRFCLPAAQTIDSTALRARCEGRRVEVIDGALAPILAAADAAVVASGTATLQVAITGTPLVIAYRIGPVTAAIARRMLQVPFIGLPNLVAGREVVEELIQEDCTAEKIAAAVRSLLQPERAAEVRRGLEEVRRGLGKPGAFRRAAGVLLEMLGTPVASGEARP